MELCRNCNEREAPKGKLCLLCRQAQKMNSRRSVALREGPDLSHVPLLGSEKYRELLQRSTAIATVSPSDDPESEKESPSLLVAQKVQALRARVAELRPSRDSWEVFLLLGVDLQQHDGDGDPQGEYPDSDGEIMIDSFTMTAAQLMEWALRYYTKFPHGPSIVVR